ncbi:PTS transporter subunit EIIC [Mollicutes bacterium LVI A0039]|nr:PTS transporter subunit EIIC [Mollicutes bacterium LVI A0039]
MDSKFMNKLMEIGAKVGGQKHMSAIRDAFAYTMPLIMGGALALTINNVLFSGGSILALIINNIAGLDSAAGELNAFSTWTSTYLTPWFASVDAGTLSILTVAFVISFAYIRAQQEDVEPITTVLVTLGAFFILQPLSRVSDNAGWLSNFLGAMGLFGGMLVSFTAPELYFYFTKKGWTIKMPDMVPPAVGKGFAAIIPGGITFLVFAIVPAIFGLLVSKGMAPTDILTVDGVVTDVPITNIFGLIEKIVVTPLINFFSGDSENFFGALIGVTLIDLLKQVFWFFGLHGANMIAPVMNSVWGVFDTLNAQAFLQEGANADLIPWTSLSWTIYVNHGGSGATLGLLAAIKIFNKRPDTEAVANIGLAPGLFEINEPIIFGMPIVLNPIYMIPFVFVSPILTIVAYTSVHFGFGGIPVNQIPWTTPPIVAAWLATNGSIEAVLLAIITLVLSVLLYAPFVILSNKEYEKQEELNN